MSSVLKRDPRIDSIRLLAIGAILACHFASKFGSPLASVAHDVLAPFGNGTFFIISAMMMGKKWRAAGRPAYGVHFLVRCVRRIMIPVLLFLVPYIIWLWCTGSKITAFQTIFNLLGFCWFAKLPAAGHLWFVTAILIFYFLVVGLTRAYRRWKRAGMLVVMLTALVFSLFVQAITLVRFVPLAWFLTYLLIGSVVFICDWEKWLQRLQGGGAMISGVYVSIFAAGAMFIPGIKDSLEAKSWLTFLMVLPIILLLMKILRQKQLNNTMSSLCLMGMEVYLVHCLFIENVILPFQELRMIWPVWLVVYLVGSVAAAFVLDRLVYFVNKAIDR